MVGTRYVMSCTLLLLGMYVADCAACGSHTHTHTHTGGGVGGCMFSSFPQSHPTQQTRSLCCCLSVCLLYIGFSVVVCTLLYTFGVGRGNLGGFRRGVREGVSRVDSPALGSAEDYLTVPLLCIPEPVCGFGLGSYLPGEGKGGLVGLVGT